MGPAPAQFPHITRRSRSTAALARRQPRRAARAATIPAQPHLAARQANGDMTTSIQTLESRLAAELGRVVVGAESSIRALVVALVAHGHVLVQGVPGLGKTLLAKSL